MLDSSTSSRSTANRTAAPGSAGRKVGKAPGEPAAAEGVGVGAAGVASGSTIPVTVYTPRRSVRANVTLRASLVGAMRSSVVPSGRSTRTPMDPSGMPSVTGAPGAIASAGVSEPPSSSPARLASRIGNATWSGRSDRRGSKDSTAAGRPARMPAYRSGEPPGPGITGRAQAGSVIFFASEMCTVVRST